MDTGIHSIPKSQNVIVYYNCRHFFQTLTLILFSSLTSEIYKKANRNPVLSLTSYIAEEDNDVLEILTSGRVGVD